MVALGGAAREALRLADVLEAMLSAFAEAIVSGNRHRIAEARRLDDVLDRLNAAIRGYLAGLDREAMRKRTPSRHRDPHLCHQHGARRRRGGPQPAGMAVRTSSAAGRWRPGSGAN